MLQQDQQSRPHQPQFKFTLPGHRQTGSASKRRSLTDRDLLREMLQIFPYASQHNGFPQAQEASIRQGALQMIIFEELVYQEAVRRKMAVPTQQVTQAETEFKKQFHSAAEYQQYLKVEMGGSEQAVRDKIKRSLLIEQVLKAEVEDKSLVTLADLRAYYDKNPSKFRDS